MRTVRVQDKPADRPNEAQMIGDMPADPNYKYLKIEKPSTAVPGYRPDYSKYKQMGYARETVDPEITGHEDLELWKVPIEKYNASQADIEMEAKASFSNPTHPGEDERVQEGTAMTLSQLAEAARGQ